MPTLLSYIPDQYKMIVAAAEHVYFKNDLK